MEKLALFSHADIEIKKDINLEKFTTIKLAKNGSIALVKTEESLIELISFLRENEIQYHLVGWGANQVLATTEEVLFIKLVFPFDREVINGKDEEFYLPASAPLNQLSSLAAKYGLIGWEVFTGVPASLGGAIVMNAGTSLGEIGTLVKSVRILREIGEVETFECDEHSFVYRNNNFIKQGDIILGATMKNLGIDFDVKDRIENYLSYRKRLSH